MFTRPPTRHSDITPAAVGSEGNFTSATCWGTNNQNRSKVTLKPLQGPECSLALVIPEHSVREVELAFLNLQTPLLRISFFVKCDKICLRGFALMPRFTAGAWIAADISKTPEFVRGRHLDALRV